MTTKSFIKTIGEKGLLADYNTEGKKLLTELTSGTYGIDISGNAATASAAASGSALETAINAKADGDNSVAIFDGYMRRMNESAGWRRVAYKQFNNTNTNLNALFRLYLIGSNNEHIGLGDLIVNIRFNSSGSAPDFKTCYLMSNKPLNTSIKLKVVGVAGNAVVEVWFRPPTFSLLMLSCIGNGYDVNANTKDWTFGKYLSSTDPEPVEDIANNVYVFSGTVKRVQLDIDNPTDGNLVAMDEKGLVKDSGIRITSSNIANWNGKMDRQTVGNVSEPVYLENGIAKVATNVATKTETEEAISNSVDQTYSSKSTKAQSGVAVNKAFKTRETSTSDDSYTYLGMNKNYEGKEELYWKLVSFNAVGSFWTLQFEIDVSNGRKSNGSFDTEIYETKRLNIYGLKPGSVDSAKVLRYVAQGIDTGRGYVNNIYYEIGSSNLVTVYIKAANMHNKTQLCRLKDVINIQGISNITWYKPVYDAGTQPTNPVKFKEYFPAIASPSSKIGSDSVPVYVNKGKPVSCNSSNLKAGKDDDGNVIKNTYQKKLTFDTTPTAGSTNPVTSGGIKTAIDSAAGSATAKKFTGYNTSNIVTGSWYIIALKNGGVGEWERLYEFLIGSNDNSSEQMRVLFSPRISSKGTFDDSKVFISGHIIKNTSLLENWKFATLKDTAGTTYTALCVKGTNSTSSRSVYWNVRSVRGNNDWIPVSINLDTTKDYTKVSELPFNGPNSLPNCITTDSVTMNKSGNEFNASLPITSGAMFGYLTDNACKPSKAIILPCGGANITQTGGSWTSTWRQKDCILDGNGMLDVTASFGINIINQHTYVATITSGTCALCDWNGNVVASAEFTMPKHIDNTLVYTITDNVSLRFVVPACESNFNNGLKVVITLPSNYTIDDQVNISNFTLNGTYWRNGTGYNSNTITFDS